MIELPSTTIEAQHGLVTTEQLAQAGFSPQDTRWLITSHRLDRISPRVLRLVGAPHNAAERVLAAVLDSGSALSHSSALAWWKVPGFPLDALHVTHTRDGVHRPRRLADHLHDKVLLPDHHVRVLDGVPVVTPARALFDLAGMPRSHPLRVERAVDNAWNKRLVSGRTLQAMLRELARRGRPGITTMREILSRRGPDYVPPASGLEARVEQILAPGRSAASAAAGRHRRRGRLDRSHRLRRRRGALLSGGSERALPLQPAGPAVRRSAHRPAGRRRVRGRHRHRHRRVAPAPGRSRRSSGEPRPGQAPPDPGPIRTCPRRWEPASIIGGRFLGLAIVPT